jgi:hypothetical protein
MRSSLRLTIGARRNDHCVTSSHGFTSPDNGFAVEWSHPLRDHACCDKYSRSKLFCNVWQTDFHFEWLTNP